MCSSRLELATFADSSSFPCGQNDSEPCCPPLARQSLSREGAVSLSKAEKLPWFFVEQGLFPYQVMRIHVSLHFVIDLLF